MFFKKRFNGIQWFVPVDDFWLTVNVDTFKSSSLLGVGEIESAKEPPTI